MNIERTEIKDDHVRCPQCSSVFQVRQHVANGAAYARKMGRLPPSSMRILSWWIENTRKPLTKQLLRKQLSYVTNVGAPLDARISELKSWKLLNVSYRKVVAKNGVIRLTPTYQLNIAKAKKILAAGGLRKYG